MGNVLVQESSLAGIADAIREKLGAEARYKPGEMAGAIRSIEGAGAPVIAPLSVTGNGTYTAPEGTDGYNPVVVEVPQSQPNLQSKTATENGTVTPDEGYDGLSSVVVNVSGGGGGDASTYPQLDYGYRELTLFTLKATVKISEVASEQVTTFFSTYAKDKISTFTTPGLTQSQLKADADGLYPMLPTLSGASGEYYGNAYGNTSMISALGLVLLGNFSGGGAASGNALSDSIDNYSAVLLNGVYNRQPGNTYNTTMLYMRPSIGVSYWAGMKDRNKSYDCGVTFTDSQTVSLTGNRQVVIYGVP